MERWRTSGRNCSEAGCHAGVVGMQEGVCALAANFFGMAVLKWTLVGCIVLLMQRPYDTPRTIQWG